MKNCFLLFALCLGLFACDDAPAEQSSQPAAPEASTENSPNPYRKEVPAVPAYDNPPPVDSARLLAVIAYRDSINENRELKTSFSEPHLNVERDRLHVAWMEGRPARVVFSQSDATMQQRNFWYFKGSELVFYRHQHWQKIEPTFAEEFNYFIDGGKIFYATGLRIPLYGEQKPLVMEGLERLPLKINRDSMMQVITEFYRSLQPYMPAHP
ncbi:MAG: hypothetical protein D6765_04290 [Bacteroidetes bacterium]|nr:MAG: hypothetical protein D6765_04290 [Bacteroidota bacterium]